MIGVTFGQKHSYDDFRLILESTQIGAPEPVRYLIDVPGRNGLLDLTDVITPNVRYRNRIISYNFNTIGHVNWQEKMREVASYLHGKKLRVIDDSDPEWFWEGVCTVAEQSSIGALGTLMIQVDAYPFKLKTTETTKSITRSGTLNATNGRMEVTPEITNTASATIAWGTKSVTLNAGTHKVSDIVLKEGDNTFTITSTGTTTFRYREGAL